MVLFLCVCVFLFGFSLAIFWCSPHTLIEQFSHVPCFDFTSCFGSSPQWSYACFHLWLTLFSCVFVCNCVPSCLTVWLFLNAEMGSAEIPVLEWLISVSSIKSYYIRPCVKCVCVTRERYDQYQAPIQDHGNKIANKQINIPDKVDFSC